MRNGKEQSLDVVRAVHDGVEFSVVGYGPYVIELNKQYDAPEKLRERIAWLVDQNQIQATREVVDYVRSLVDNRVRVGVSDEVAAALRDIVENTEAVFKE